MNIGQAATLSNLPRKTIRYYEEVELVIPLRQSNGYRDYNDYDVKCLGFVQRARKMGFSVDECRSLLALYKDEHRASADVKNLAKEKLSEIYQKIEDLTALAEKLQVLLDVCPGNEETQCPILAGLELELDSTCVNSVQDQSSQHCH